MSEYHCLCCDANFDNEDDALKHPCNKAFRMKNGVISIEMSKFTGLKRTRWGRFVDRVLELDIAWGLAFMGIVVMNCVLIRHINLTPTEAIIESLSLGFAIPRLLK